MRFSQKAVFITLVVESTSALSTPQLLKQRFTSSAFTPRRDVVFSKSNNRSPIGRSNTMLMFEAGVEPPPESVNGNVRSVLANTDQWIAETLGQHTRARPNPYSRKEVSYVCETSRNEPIMAVANIFRQFKEARDLGESHSKTEGAIVADMGPDYVPDTLRQTLAVVIPWCDSFQSFQSFEAVHQAINTARRAAHDYVTDISFEMNGDGVGRDWMVTVSSASLHPNYGAGTEEETLSEVDPQQEVNKRKRLLARQSPYPTLALELNALPPTDFNVAPSSPIEGGVSYPGSSETDTGGPTREDLSRLEALFRISSTTKNICIEEHMEDSSLDLIGNASGIDEVSVDNSIISAKEWLIQNDPLHYPEMSSFISTDTKHVDAAYEAVFTTIATHKISNPSEYDDFQSCMGNIGRDRSYILMPNFLPSSATSLEKFSYEISNILQNLRLNKPYSVSIFHPEHVISEKRCPVPTVVFQWHNDMLRP